MHEIPFGKHKESGIYFDAGTVPSGLKCNCVCSKCGTDLEAVNRKIPRVKNYFRHASRSGCKGGLESLFHNVSKQILKENSSLQISMNLSFTYTACDIERPRHGKQPDAFLNNDAESLIVEIYFWHRIDNSTLETYLINKERVLEIDISKQRKDIFDYEYLKELILFKAPRELFVEKKEVTPIIPDDVPWWLWALFAVGIGFFIWKFRKCRKRKRRRRRW